MNLRLLMTTIKALWLLLRGRQGDAIVAELHDWEPPGLNLRLAGRACLCGVVLIVSALGLGTYLYETKWAVAVSAWLIIMSVRQTHDSSASSSAAPIGTG